MPVEKTLCAFFAHREVSGNDPPRTLNWLLTCAFSVRQRLGRVVPAGVGQPEAMQILKNRSPALNLTPQDIDEITDRSEVVFEAEQ